jgi:diguanylate cyclase (GGDEF)-like protein
MELILINRIKVFSLLFVACLVLFSNLANCAQLVNDLPTKLERNWEICKHFSSSPPQCTSADTLSINLPKDENTTHYEYTKQFIVSSDFQEELLGLFLGRIDEVDQVRINGRLIGKSGRFPPNYQTAFRHQRLYFIPPSIIKYNQFNLIEVKTFSSIGSPGLEKSTVEIGQYFALKKDRKTSNHIFVIAISVLIVLALFQLFYFLMVRESEETLFLSIFLIAFAIVAYARSEYPMHIGFNLTTTLKIEMFMISSGLIGLVLFAFRFFELRIGRDHLIFILLIGLPGIVSIIYPEPTHTRIIAEVGYWLICIASLIIGLYIFLSTQLKNRKYIRVIIIFSLIFWLTMGYDALSQTRWMVNFEFNLRPWLLPIMVTTMGVAMALTMTHRYWQLFKGATYDHLTGTLLRPAFFQRLSAELQRSQIDQSLLLVAVINIKGIRNITANYGLQARDRTLKVISRILTNQLKPFDLICHFNDNEFCVAATIDSREQGTEYIEDIHQRLTSSQFIIDKETELFVGVKIGGVIYNPDQHLSISQILLDANYALAKAKDKKGKDYWLQNNPTVTA